METFPSPRELKISLEDFPSRSSGRPLLGQLSLPRYRPDDGLGFPSRTNETVFPTKRCKVSSKNRKLVGVGWGPEEDPSLSGISWGLGVLWHECYEVAVPPGTRSTVRPLVPSPVQRVVDRASPSICRDSELLRAWTELNGSADFRGSHTPRPAPPCPRT